MDETMSETGIEDLALHNNQDNCFCKRDIESFNRPSNNLSK